MPTAKITDKLVAQISLPVGRSDLIVWDTDLTGFALRVRPGSKSWIVAYRPRGAGRRANMKRLKLGSVQVITRAADARQLARETLGKVANGIDPLALRDEDRRRSKAKLSDLLDRYEADLGRRGYVNRRTVMSGLRTKMSSLMTRDIRDISGAELAQIIERFEQAGKRGAAQDFRTHCRAFMGWCVTKARVLPTNPLAGHRKGRATRADRIAKVEHGRALSDHELAQIWTAADPATTFGRLIRFYILTGCRRGEGAGLARGMIEEAALRIDLPAVFVKQGRAHEIFIAPLLSDLLGRCSVDARSDLVFASPRSGTKISGWTQLLKAFGKRCSVPFELHDLRRTFRTGLSRLGVEADVAELALGHARADLEAIYNRDKREAALRDAFAKWDAHVKELTTAEALDLFA